MVTWKLLFRHTTSNVLSAPCLTYPINVLTLNTGQRGTDATQNTFASTPEQYTASHQPKQKSSTGWVRFYLITFVPSCLVFMLSCDHLFQSQWPSGLRRGSAAARLLGLPVRIPPGAWMFVCCECCVFVR
jgi:hypothetical protein